MNFPDTADRHLQDLTSRVDHRRCPDQYVGRLAEMQSLKALGSRQPASKRPRHQPCVLLILESPHIREYVGDPGPAKGSTGISIANRLQRAIGREFPEEFGLLLINAIQFQCSLGLPTIVKRDEVFIEMWKKGGRDDFIKRLRSLFLPGDVIVNACTRGSVHRPADQLRTHVQQAIEASLPGQKVLRRTHPSSWHSRANLKYEWPYPV